MIADWLYQKWCSGRAWQAGITAAVMVSFFLVIGLLAALATLLPWFGHLLGILVVVSCFSFMFYMMIGTVLEDIHFWRDREW